ncbi:DUF3107 domain-containing protein [Gleimia sp. 6138-11-ORH1]|uniref:DUF3107 domain-containing protein n=1 Tax=Gleimia sp. 6138-11-ORH1 TaxID=2973937 RepID=UPI00216A94A5|nr:DUF3107 domain-containing protein [Gleimia sp. 6138-11-ORH1]MCS4483978.1 DUF3107 domain-containing protein [Gleimia sp. 6138-11-ORH1]
MVVTIGVAGCTRELRLDLDLNVEELHSLVETALSEKTPVRLQETSGNVVIIPAAALGYVLVTEEKPRPVGFTVG